MARITRAFMLLVLLAAAPAARAEPPFTIGLDLGQTGALAANGKAALLAMQIWVQDTNAKGGLLGRPVRLLTYDDQSNPALVPGIITKLLDVDKVDLLIAGNGTNMVAPALPIAMQRHLTLVGLFGLGVNSEFHYPNYFSIIPAGGANPREAFSAPFFAVAKEADPRPKTIALVGADAEFSRNALDGARALAKRDGYRIVYDKTYPPTTTDYSPIIRAIQATNPDMVFVGSYPPDTVGMIRAANEVGLNTKLFGGGMVGLQATAIKTQLGPLLNGIVNYDFWLPVGPYATPEAKAFLAKYQARVGDTGVDALGFYLPPFAYADLQVVGEAVTATHGTDQAKLADYLRSHTFHTIVGDIKFGPNGEWAEPRVLEVQFQGVKGHDLAQFRDMKAPTVLYPPALKNGTLRYPYTSAKD
ncbi:MAG TPA: amino acid ABC transporter substrate-binding protein [Rhodopila sp.]|uniref:amino acid ABC transporter substrate-binding protein n=1 Tax=Rhodopila sp. TaxID=2480087 RepID=UPI002C9FCABE|nr:amino acid ABC transporter substrate-binding protein [Rhodopila sp.]HVY18309.1 amino acid ABC transporter substrate-binding protein [Rhodopila sp.]